MRRLGQREQHPLILLGGELGFGVQVHEDDAGEDRGAEQRGHRAVVERALEAAPVAFGETREDAVDQPDKAPVQHRAAQQHRAHHRRQGDRNDARDDDGAGEGEGELAEQRPGDAAEKADRRVDRGQGQGHRDHRAGDLARPDQRRLRRGAALLDVAVDVFDDHDRVVDDEPDRQHHRQQGQQVEAEAQGRHQGPGADQRQRDRDDRDHHRAQAAEEQKDHDDDDADRHGQRELDLVDRGLDELRRIVGDLHDDRGRQVALDLGQERAHVAHQGQRVAGRRRLDADEHRALAVHRHARGPALRRQIDGGDVLKPHQRAVLALDHHLLELRCVVEPGVGGDVGDREIALRLARRRLVVVGLDRRGDIAGGDPARRHPHGIEPQPHREDLAAEDVGRGDAGDGDQERLHHPGQVIRDRRARQLVAGKADIHDRRGLAGGLGDDRVLRPVRDQVLDLLHLGHDLGQRLVGVEIEPDIGGDRAGALDRARGQVVDALGGRHRLRQRCGDEALHQVGRGAGIDRGDGDRRVRELRVLPDRQLHHRAQPDQEDQQADDQRQHRSADEDIGERHGLVERGGQFNVGVAGGVGAGRPILTSDPFWTLT